MWKAVKILMLAGLLTAGIMSSAQALPEFGVDVMYYSDDTMTTQVGEHYRDCQNGHFDEGVRSRWSTGDSWTCNDGEYLCWTTVCSGIDSNGEPWGCQTSSAWCDF
ncbi:MAG TPA: hypothetical protein VGQ21_09590 [Thermoanaerobaculia bacterium]|jgi:hypothetical protein|nr:hypothetical protein [Thermoanaerobaculia bacterium]